MSSWQILGSSCAQSQTVPIRQKAMGKSKPPKKPGDKFLRGIRSIKPLAVGCFLMVWHNQLELVKHPSSLHHWIPHIWRNQFNTFWATRLPSFPIAHPVNQKGSEASYKVEGEESRHLWILSVLESRRVRPANETSKSRKKTKCTLKYACCHLCFCVFSENLS